MSVALNGDSKELYISKDVLALVIINFYID